MCQSSACSAASRAFVPRSVWDRMGDDFITKVGGLSYGDVTDLGHYGGAVIDQRAFDRNAAAIERAKATSSMTRTVVTPANGRLSSMPNS